MLIDYSHYQLEQHQMQTSSMYFIKRLGGRAWKSRVVNLIRWNQQIDLSKQIYDNSEITLFILEMNDLTYVLYNRTRNNK